MNITISYFRNGFFLHDNSTNGEENTGVTVPGNVMSWSTRMRTKDSGHVKSVRIKQTQFISTLIVEIYSRKNVIACNNFNLVS